MVLLKEKARGYDTQSLIKTLKVKHPFPVRRGEFLYTYRILINMFSVLRYYLYAARYGIDQLCENAV